MRAGRERTPRRAGEGHIRGSGGWVGKLNSLSGGSALKYKREKRDEIIRRFAFGIYQRSVLGDHRIKAGILCRHRLRRTQRRGREYEQRGGGRVYECMAGDSRILVMRSEEEEGSPGKCCCVYGPGQIISPKNLWGVGRGSGSQRTERPGRFFLFCSCAARTVRGRCSCAARACELNREVRDARLVGANLDFSQQAIQRARPVSKRRRAPSSTWPTSRAASKFVAVDCSTTGTSKCPYVRQLNNWNVNRRIPLLLFVSTTTPLFGSG